MDIRDEQAYLRDLDRRGLLHHSFTSGIGSVRHIPSLCDACNLTGFTGGVETASELYERQERGTQSV